MDRFNINDFLTRLQSSPGWAAGNILDVRSSQQFREGHVSGSVSHSLGDTFPSEDAGYLDRELPSIFLPPRHEPLVVVAAGQEAADRLARHLAGRERAPVTGLALPAGGAAGLPLELKETGPSARCLWQPPLWLRRYVDLLPPPKAGPVLDLACGSGRAAVWLAEKGYRVTGIDWQAEALDLGRRLATNRGVSCRFLLGDLRNAETLPAGPWSVILNFRFRQTDLLEKLPGLMQTGGVALVRTFRSAPGYEGHPSPRYRLGPCELLGYFPAGKCEILAHEESHDPDGRPAAGIVARKK